MATKKSKKNNSEIKKIFTKLPQTDEEFYKIADDLVEWSKKDSSLEFNEFSLSLRIIPDKFLELTKLNDYFSQAYYFALETIGNRIEHFAKAGKIDKSFALAILPLYKRDYKKWLLELRHKEAGKESNKPFTVVYLEKMPSTGLVPPRIIKENKEQDFEATNKF